MNETTKTEKTTKDDLLSGYWECPKCGTANRPENETCYFRCTINESMVHRPEQLNG